jgi:hypothetical protein
MEIWKEIEGYEGLYEISNYGNVRSMNYKKRGYIKILKGQINKHGYVVVDLSKNKVRKTCQVHRLVAKAFIPNPDNLAVVDHIDSNKTNNHVNNLQWLTYQDNTLKAWDDGLCSGGSGRPRSDRKVINLTTGVVYDSVVDAAKLNNMGNSGIYKCCKHQRKTSGGYEWQYYDEYLDGIV